MHKLGQINHWLGRSWRPPVFWLIVTASFIWLGERIAIYFSLFNLKSGTWFQIWNILGVYALSALLWWAWQARKRVVIEEFVDYTGDSAKSSAKGLATLLIIMLAQLRNLHQEVNEQRLISTYAEANQSVKVTINAEDVSGFLKGAASAESKISLGPLQIPVGTLLALVGHLVQGPRIIGSLHKDNNHYILTAQRIGGKKANSWRVDSPLRSSTKGAEQENYSLDDMIMELAYRIFADLELKEQVRWSALVPFSEGLRLYRDCLHDSKNKKLKLKQAEKKFIKTVSEDKQFELAYYNLGVLYSELEQVEAAEIAFQETIQRNPNLWQAYYALMVCHHQRRQYDIVIQLSDQIIDLRPGLTNTAKAYHWKGLAQLELKKELEDIINSRKKAVVQSWEALYIAELEGLGMVEEGVSVIPQLEALASVCLINLALAYKYLGLRYKQAPLVKKGIARLLPPKRWSSVFRLAEVLFRQASYLTPAEASYYFELAKMYIEWEKYSQAVREIEIAIMLQPKNAEFSAYLAFAYAKQKNEDAALRACQQALVCASQATESTLEKTAEVYETLGDNAQRDRVKGFKGLQIYLQELEKRGPDTSAINHLEEQRKKKYNPPGLEWEYAQIVIALGRLYLKLGCPGKAELRFGMAIEKLKENHSQEIKSQELRAWLARSLLEQKAYRDALQKAEEALSLDPLSFFARDVLGQVYSDLGEFEHAIAVWQEALLQKADSPDTYFKIGAAYVHLVWHQRNLLARRTTALQEAIKYFGQALDLYTSEQQREKGLTRYFLGILHLERREYVEAISCFKIAKALFSTSPLSSKLYLGYAYLKNREYNECLEQILSLLREEKLEKLKKDDSQTSISINSKEEIPLRVIVVQAHWMLAAVYTEGDGTPNLQEALKQVEAAEGYMKRLCLNEDDVKAVYKVANCLDTKGWIYYKQGNVAAAIDCLEEALTRTIDSEIYWHLALAYESKLQGVNDQTEVRFLKMRIQSYCNHIRELDIQEEYKQPVEDLLQRIKDSESPKDKQQVEAERSCISTQPQKNVSEWEVISPLFFF